MNSSNGIRIFLGFDQAEAVAWNTFVYSIQRRSSVAPVYAAPVMLSQLEGVFDRPWHPKQSNEFSFSRWMVPYLCGYEGWAMFADCDMLCLGDIAELWEMRDDRYAVMVVKHDHRPEHDTKYLGRPQSWYPKKNWSSVMLIKCSRCSVLTPEYVNAAEGLDLHQFKWLGDDDLIGELPKEWNHLVGYDVYNPEAKIVHFTEGGPYFGAYKDCDYHEEWWREFRNMAHCEDLSWIKTLP